MEIKNIVIKNKYIKFFLIIFVLSIYFKTFFSIGVYYDDIFLKKEVIGTDVHYKGKTIFGVLHITVKGIKNRHDRVDVIYRLPNDINEQYTVIFKDPNNWDLGITSIKDENGNVVFEGTYKKGSYFLFDKNGKPILDNKVRVYSNGASPYNDYYRIGLKSIVKFAMFENDRIRGDYINLFFAIFLSIILLIDIKFPLFFFRC